MKITSLKKYKGQTYEAELDYERKIYLHADIIVDFGLREDDELDRNKLREIIWASNFRRAYQRALYLLDYRDYSRAEMYKKLLSNYKSERLCTAVADKLEKNGIIDDERYAEKLAVRYVSVRKFGYRRAKREMMMKGIDQFTADDALEPYSQEFGENLMTLLETKHARNLTDRSDRKAVERVKASLARYGYGFDEINRCIKEYFENNLED